MQDSASTPVTDPCADAAGADTRRIIGYVYFTFICYLSISLPLAVLPPYVHLRMGFSAALAGLVVSIQYIATLASRPWAGRISDRSGAKVSVLAGMAGAALPDLDKPTNLWFGWSPFPGPVNRFHGRIQHEAPRRAHVELMAAGAFACAALIAVRRRRLPS